MKRGRVVKCEGIKLPNIEVEKEGRIHIFKHCQIG